MDTLTQPMTPDQIMEMLKNVIVNVDDIYKKTHTKTEYLTYKLGKSASRFVKFMRSPQMKVINLVLFWAVFVASWIITAVASGSFLAFLAFGAIIAIYTDLTATAVSAIIKDTILNYYSGTLKHV